MLYNTQVANKYGKILPSFTLFENREGYANMAVLLVGKIGEDVKAVGKFFLLN